MKNNEKTRRWFGSLYRPERLFMRRDLLRRVVNTSWRSEDINHADWGKTDVTVTPSDTGTRAPDGSDNAALIQEAGAGGTTHEVFQYIDNGSSSASNATPDAPLTVSAFVKKKELSWMYITIDDDVGDVKRAFFDIATGNLGSYRIGNVAVGQILEAGIDPYPDGWWRVWLTVRTSAASVFVAFGLAQQDGQDFYTQTAGNGLWLWGTQFEDNKDFVGPYVRTPGSASVTEDSPHSQRITDGELVRIVTSFTPAATPDYAAANAFGGLLEFPNAVFRKGGTGEIVGLEITSDEPGILTAANVRAYFMNKTFTPTADNAVFNLTPAVANTVQAIMFAGDTDPVAAVFIGLVSSDTIHYKPPRPIPYVLEASTTSLFGQLSIHQAANFGASKTITVNLIVRRF